MKWAGFRVLLFALLAATQWLAACQYLQPRSVDEIEKGRLPAPIEREDTRRDGVPVSPPASGPESGIGGSLDADEARIAAQRESAARDGVTVFSVGAATAAGFRGGSSLAFQFVAEGSAEKGVVAIDLTCRNAPCQDRSVAVGGQHAATRYVVSVLALTPGRWRLQAVQLYEVSRDVRGEKTTLTLKNPPRFDVRVGHATYLGAFAVIGGALHTRDADGDETVSLPIVRFADIEVDMTQALADFPEARGRRMLNATRGISTPQTLH